MLNSTTEADDVGDYLRVKYPEEFGATTAATNSFSSSTPIAVERSHGKTSTPPERLRVVSTKAIVHSMPSLAS